MMPRNDTWRGRDAHLRLAVQKLCKLLGEKGKDINQDIAKLIKKGCAWRFSKPWISSE